MTIAGCSGETPSTATGPATPGSTTDEATPEARSDARLSLANNGGRVRYDGAVDSEASQQRVVDALVAAFGDAATGQVDVDPTVRPPDWLDGLPAFAEAFTMPGAAVTFDGDTIELSGQVPREERARLLALAEDLFPDHVYTGLLQGTADGGNTPAALAQLPAGADGPALVEALNTVTIAFEAGSARIAPGSLDAIGRIADAIANERSLAARRVVDRLARAGEFDQHLGQLLQRGSPTGTDIVEAIAGRRLHRPHVGEQVALRHGKAFHHLIAAGADEAAKAAYEEYKRNNPGQTDPARAAAESDLTAKNDAAKAANAQYEQANVDFAAANAAAAEANAKAFASGSEADIKAAEEASRKAEQAGTTAERAANDAKAAGEAAKSSYESFQSQQSQPAPNGSSSSSVQV